MASLLAISLLGACGVTDDQGVNYRVQATNSEGEVNDFPLSFYGRPINLVASTLDPGATVRVDRTKDSVWTLKPKDDSEKTEDFQLDVSSDPDFVIVHALPPIDGSKAIGVCAEYLHHKHCTRVLIFEDGPDQADPA
jgi:hypothetical protein